LPLFDYDPKVNGEVGLIADNSKDAIEENEQTKQEMLFSMRGAIRDEHMAKEATVNNAWGEQVLFIGNTTIVGGGKKKKKRKVSRKKRNRKGLARNASFEPI
jgi:hypothetical protein